MANQGPDPRFSNNCKQNLRRMTGMPGLALAIAAGAWALAAFIIRERL